MPIPRVLSLKERQEKASNYSDIYVGKQKREEAVEDFHIIRGQKRMIDFKVPTSCVVLF